MKKIQYIFMGLAAVAMAASCSLNQLEEPVKMLKEGEDDEHPAAHEEGQYVCAFLPIIQQQCQGDKNAHQGAQAHHPHGQGGHVTAHSRTVPSFSGPRIFTAVP